MPYLVISAPQMPMSVKKIPFTRIFNISGTNRYIIGNNTEVVIMTRKIYLDHIRTGTVLMVVVYHVFYLFNAQGVLGGFGGFSDVQYQDAILYVLYPFFMVLLFLIAGISARYSLMKKTAKEFINSRTAKLLVPSTLGLFVFYWICGFFNVAISGSWSMMPDEMPLIAKYLICVLSGIGPLWFAQMLWLFSLSLLLIRKIDKNNKFYDFCGKANLPVIISFVLLMWGSAQILNTPIITVYRFGIYYTAFLLGYFVFSHDKVQDCLAKYSVWFLAAALVSCVAYVIYWFGKNYASDECLQDWTTAVYLWVCVLAVMGCGKRWFDKKNQVMDYLIKRSFGIYALHYTAMLFLCCAMIYYMNLPVALIYIIAIIGIFAMSIGLYELISRIPVLRYLVLGERRKKQREIQAEN